MLESDRAELESEKPRLLAVSVPWQVSPSTPFLRLMASEDGNVAVTFVAHYKCEHTNGTVSGESIKVVEPPGEFQLSNGTERGPFRLVRITFKNGLWVRMYPSFSDTEVIEEAAFDWSQVDGVPKPGEDVAGFLRRTQDQWLDSGVCPNPGMYEVERSTWLSELGADEHLNQQCWHYLIVGSDSYVEVAATDWQWEEGQVMRGWE